MAKKKHVPAEILEANPVVEPSDTLLNSLIGYALRRCQLKLTQRLVEALTPYEIRPAQLSALLIIEASPGLMQADLARMLAIEPPQLVPLLNKLEKLGLAVRVRCKPDKRSYGIFLSKTGEQQLKVLKMVAAQSDRDATSMLSDEEREHLLHLLQRIRSSPEVETETETSAEEMPT